MKRRRRDPCAEKEEMTYQGAVFSKTFFEQPPRVVEALRQAAISVGFKNRKGAPGGRTRMYFESLDRKSCKGPWR